MGTVLVDTVYNPDTKKRDIPVRSVSTSTGVLQKGIMHGQWIHREESGFTEKGPQVYGKRHGHWIVGNRYYSSEGSYVDGKRHGLWVRRESDGEKSKGEYIDGKAEGTWLFYDPESRKCWSLTYHQGESVGSRHEVNQEMCQW